MYKLVIHILKNLFGIAQQNIRPTEKKNGLKYANETISKAGIMNKCKLIESNFRLEIKRVPKQQNTGFKFTCQKTCGM